MEKKMKWHSTVTEKDALETATKVDQTTIVQ